MIDTYERVRNEQALMSRLISTPYRYAQYDMDNCHLKEEEERKEERRNRLLLLEDI